MKSSDAGNTLNVRTIELVSYRAGVSSSVVISVRKALPPLHSKRCYDSRLDSNYEFEHRLSIGLQNEGVSNVRLRDRRRVSSRNGDRWLYSSQKLEEIRGARDRRYAAEFTLSFLSLRYYSFSILFLDFTAKFESPR